MNLTNSSITDNREMLAVDSNPDEVAEAEAIFQADFKGASITPAGPLVVAPDNARQDLLNLVNGAKKSVDIEAEELSDDKLTAALTGLVANGVAVRVVLSDQTPTQAEQQSIALLKQHKIPVVSVASPYIHTKTILVDGQSAYVGSANLTFYSLTANRELGVIVTAPDAISSISATISKDFKAGKAL